MSWYLLREQIRDDEWLARPTLAMVTAFGDRQSGAQDFADRLNDAMRAAERDGRLLAVSEPQMMPTPGAGTLYTFSASYLWQQRLSPANDTEEVL